MRVIVGTLLLAALVVPGLESIATVVPHGAPAVVLSRDARDSMTAAFRHSNEHWDEQANLNTMERMLGTIRPTQREYLGCLQGRIGPRTIRIESWVPAADMKQLPLAVAGHCDSVPRLVGTWHTHPYRADLQNLPIKERRLSAQDLATFADSRLNVVLVMWDQDSVDAAVRDAEGAVVHPARVAVD